MTDAHRNIAQLINEARYTHQPVITTDHGKPAAAFISPDQFARYQAPEDAADQAAIDEIRAAKRWIPNDGAQAMLDEIEANAEAEAADRQR